VIVQEFERQMLTRLDASTRARPSGEGLPNAEEMRVLADCMLGTGLRTEFQPVLDLRNGTVFAYEALSRGPAGSAFERPAALFSLARAHGFDSDIEMVAVKLAVERFAAAGAPAKLFVNFSPRALAKRNIDGATVQEYMAMAGMRSKEVVIELTENHVLTDSSPAWTALLEYRQRGYEIAIDDLGEGFASLRLWSVLNPEFVKIDRHFVDGIHGDPIKLQMARAIVQIAAVAGANVIAEGVEHEADLQVVRDLGIRYCQGYLIARPAAEPRDDEALGLWRRMSQDPVVAFPVPGRNVNLVSARTLLRRAEAVSPETENDLVFARFESEPDLPVVPVVRDGRPVGLVNRHAFIDRFARPYRRELYGRKPVSALMNEDPAIVEADMSIQEIGQLVSGGRHNAVMDGFIIVERGRYLGIGTSADLLREITEMQMMAARYANPLTMLPGNVPISEHLERLIAQGREFCTCYGDLDNFKPFNDVFGYQRVDEVIQLAARTLTEVCDPRLDFLGHVGGDDFVTAMQSQDWELRCRKALELFGERIQLLFSEDARQEGGFVAEDRQGNRRRYPLPSLSIGAVPVYPETFRTHSEIAAAATEAKKFAKRQDGNSIFVERRRYPGGQFKPAQT
jgi:diguanylate cyclase (GGDEF)-like protein